MVTLHKSRLVQTAQYSLMFGGVVLAVAAPLILFIEAFEWVFSREWPGLTVADGLSLFGIHHDVAETDSQRALDVAMAAPLTVAMFLTGIFMFLTGINLGSWEEVRRLSRERNPIWFIALLIAGSGVSLTTVVRIIVLNPLLWLLSGIGSAVIVVGLALHFTGSPSDWIIPSGFALIIMSWFSRLILTRRLLKAQGERR